MISMKIRVGYLFRINNQDIKKRKEKSCLALLIIMVISSKELTLLILL